MPAAFLIEPSLFYCALCTLLLLLLAWSIGWLARPLHRAAWMDPAAMAAALVTGMLTLVGIASVTVLHRFNAWSLFVFVPIVVRLLRDPVQVAGSVSSMKRDALVLAGVFVGSCAFACAAHGWWDIGQRLIQPHRDMGYWAMEAQEMPKAGFASFWAAALGEATRDAGVTSDNWYHWGPIFLTSLVARSCDLSAINAMIYVVTPALFFVLAVSLAGLCQHFAIGSNARCLWVGGLVVISTPMPTRVLEKVLWSTFGEAAGCQHHLSIAFMFAYMLEACIAMTVLTAWLGGRRGFAAMLLFCTGVSAPQSVAGWCLVGGSMIIAAAALRRWRDVLLGLGIIGLQFCAWAVCELGFGTKLPRNAGTSLLLTSLPSILSALAALVMHWGLAFIASGLVLPGLWHLTKQKDARGQLAAWTIFASIFASYAAFHLLLPGGDRAHFTTYVHAIFVTMLGMVGLAAAGCGEGRRAWWARRLFVAAMLMGCLDVAWGRFGAWRPPQEYGQADLERLKPLLEHQRVGYFTNTDQYWWISRHGSMSALLESRFVRLNPLYGPDVASEAAKIYGSLEPLKLLPREPGETDSAWALRFARRLKVRYVVETWIDQIPDDLRSSFKPVTKTAGLQVYELLP